jgi:Bifunctional DNA primase/polymerase, N-terminal
MAQPAAGSQQDNASTIESALAYAARGWPVFPCNPGSKEPWTRHGFKDATTDPAVIRWWWSRWPRNNVAIATGAPGVDVFDVDVRPEGDGFAAFDRCRLAGLLSGALALVRTPSGGLHVYFPGTGQPGRSLKALHVDLKAAGGYVVASPSVVAGKQYTVLDWRTGGHPLDWPSVVRLLAPPQAPRSMRAAARKVNADASTDALARWLARLPAGDHNNPLYWAACRAIESGHDDLEALVEASVESGHDERQARRTVDSAQRRVGAR